MKVTILPDNYNLSWYAKVELTDHEWPQIDNNDLWLHRPIYKWVTEQCDHNINFTYYGHILFEHEDDLVKFLLTWS